MTLITLPNGLTLETPNSREAQILYREIFEGGSYTRHGIDVGNGATVLDVGANVGAFSVALAQRYRDLRLVLFVGGKRSGTSWAASPTPRGASPSG